jgi:hypothetical protein
VKLRIRAGSVRLRLSEDEVARVALGESIAEQTRFPGGVLGYRLEIGGEQITARFSPAGGIQIRLPQEQAADWAASAEVTLQCSIEVDGESLEVLVEKDLKRARG